MRLFVQRFHCLFLLALFASGGLAFAQEEPEVSTGTVLGILSFSGNDSFSDETLTRQTALSPGQFFTWDQLEYSRGLLASFYEKNGYWEAHVSSSVASSGPAKADVRFSIHEGPQYRVGQVLIQNNKLVSAKIIRRELRVSPGDLFSQAKVYEGIRRLYLTQYFEKIDVHYSTAAAHTVDTTIAVKERPTQYFKGGVGYGAETKERFSLGFENRNFLGNARRLDVKLTHSGFWTNPQKYRTLLLETDLTLPYILNTRWEGRTNVSREYKERENYDSITSAWRSSLSRPLSKRLTGSILYRFEGTRTSNVSPEAKEETSRFTNISAPGLFAAYDSTDDLLFPRHGWRTTGLYEQGLTLGLGDVRFYKIQPKAMNFQRFGSRLVWMGAMQGGFMRPDTAQRPIPIFERFFLGGANTVRGYGERDLGPKDASGEPLGGEAYAAASTELRERLYRKLYGVVFFDAGQLWQRPVGRTWPHITGTRWDDYRYGTGFGFRLQTPVGPIRLEYGYKLNPFPGEGGFWNRSEIHFSLGEAF